jgi:hypothetical protein
MTFLTLTNSYSLDLPVYIKPLSVIKSHENLFTNRHKLFTGYSPIAVRTLPAPASRVGDPVVFAGLERVV